MAKPDFLKWVTDDAAAKITDPGSTKKLAGWIYTERPPFQYFNWLFNRIHKWLLGLQGGYFDIVVGSATQVTNLEATHVIADLNDTLVAVGSKVLLLPGSHILTANVALSNNDIQIMGETSAAILDLSTFTLSITGAYTNSIIHVVNAGDGDITISGVGSKFIGINVDFTSLVINGGATAETTGINGALLLNGSRVQDQSSSGIVAVAGGTVDVITGTFSPVFPSLKDGTIIVIRAIGANISTTPTFKPDALPASVIVKDGNRPLAAGDIPRADYECLLKRNNTNDTWELLNPVTYPVMFTKSYNSPQQTITIGGGLTLAHELGVIPKLIQIKLVCTFVDLSYAINDVVFINPAGDTETSRGVAISFDNTNLYIRYGSSVNTFSVLNKSSGAVGTITNSSWEMIVSVWA